VYGIASLVAATSRHRGGRPGPAEFYDDSFLANTHRFHTAVGTPPSGPWEKFFGLHFLDSLPTFLVFLCAFCAAAAVGTALGVAWARTGLLGCAVTVVLAVLCTVLVAVLLEATGTMPYAPLPGVVVLCVPTVLVALTVAGVLLARFGAVGGRR